MNDKNTNTTYKVTTHLEHTLVRRVEELEQINIRLRMDVEARELAQEGLRYGQNFLREVISSIEDTYISVFDQNCVVNFIWGPLKLKEKYGIIFQDFMGKDANDFNPQLAKNIRQVFETNQSFHGEWQEVRQENVIWWDFTLSPIRDEDNEMVAVVSATRDITENKKKEEKLRLNSQIMTNLSEGVYLVRLEDGIIVYTNPAFEEMFGYNPGEMIGKYIAAVNAPTEKTLEEIIQDRMQILLDTGEWHGEIRNIKKDGTQFWCYANVSLFDHPEYGRVIISVQTDITERKKAEVELKESEQRYRTQFEDAFDAIFIAEPETGIIVDCNKAASELVGRDKLEIIGQHQKTLHPPEMSKGEFTENFVKYRDGKKDQILETFVITKNGDLKDVSISANLIEFKGKILMQGIFRDITERIKLKQKLQLFYQINKIQHEAQDLNSLLEKIFNQILKFTNFEMGGIYLSNEDRTVAKLVYSKNLSDDFFENTKEIEINKFPHSSIFIENKGIFTEYYFKIDPIVAKKLNMGSVASIPLVSEKKVIGSLNIVRKESFIFSNEEKEFFISIGEEVGDTIQHFITQQKLKEFLERLKESEEILRSTLESIVEGILVVNEQGQITHYNSKFISMWHIPQELIEEKDDKKLINFVLNQLKDPDAFQSKVEELYGSRNEDVDTLYFKDGRIFDCSSNPLILGEEICGRVWSFRDITERKKNEVLQRESEERLRKIVEKSEAGYFFINTDGNFQHVNTAWLRMHKFSTLDEIIGKHFSETQVDIDLLEANKIVKSLIHGAPIPSGEFARRCKDGTVEYHTFSANPVIRNGEIIGLEGFIIDITERKKMEEKLKESEEKLKGFMDSATDGFIIFDSKLNYIEANNVAVQTTGMTKDELLGKNILDIAPNLKESGRYDKYLHVLKTGEPFSTEDVIFNRIDGSLSAYFSVRAFKVGINIGIIFTDITERKKVEQMLKESEEKYRTLFETMAHGVVYQSANGDITSANSAAEQILGLTIEQMQGRTSADPRWRAVHEDYSDFSGQTHPSIISLKTGKVVLNTIMGVLNPIDMEYHWININAVPQFRSGENTPFQVYTTFEDITNRKKIEQELKESEEKWKALSANSPAQITLLDREHKILFVNRALPNLSNEEVIGTYVYTLIPLEFQQIARDSLNSVWETGEPVTYSTNYISKEGNVRFFDVWVGPVFQSGKITALVTHSIDVTEHKEMEEKLKEYSDQLEIILDNIPGLIFYKDMNNNFIQVNKGIADAHNMTKEELVGKSLFSLYSHEEAQAYWDDDLEVIKSGMPKLDIEEPWDTPEGRRWVNTSKIPLKDNKGNIIGILGISTDITERKKAEEKINQLAKFPSENPNPVLRISRDGVILYNNDASSHLLETWNYFDGQTITDYYYKFVLDTLQSGESQQTEVESNGKILSLTFAPVVEFNYVNVYGLDITKRKIFEDKLKESEKFLDSIFNSISDSIAIIDPVTYEIESINKSFLNEYDIEEIDVIGKKCYEVIHNQTIVCKNQGTICPIELMLTTGNLVSLEHIHSSPNGSKKFCEVTVSPLINEREQIKQVIHIKKDITERKLAEDALRETEGILRAILNNTPDVIIMVDSNGVIQFINRSLAGFSVNYATGMKIYDIIEPQHSEIVKKKIAEIFSKGFTESVKLNISDLIGVKSLYEIRFGYIKSEWKTIATLLFLTDITEKNRIE